MENQMNTQLNNMLNNFAQTQLQHIEQGELDFKNYQLPLARIKKVMKTDDEVKPMMISAEAPIVFAKACEIFILELTLRAWMQTDECKRRTLQRNDVAVAITRSDIFDFLIDIVPREEGKMKKAEYGAGLGGEGNPYYFQQTPSMGLNFPTNSPGSLMYQQFGQNAGFENAEETQAIPE